MATSCLCVWMFLPVCSFASFDVQTFKPKFSKLRVFSRKSMSEDVRKSELKPSLSIASVPATPPPTPTTPFQKPCLQSATFMQNWKKLCNSTKLSDSEKLSAEETPSSSNDEIVAEDGLANNDELKSTTQ